MGHDPIYDPNYIGVPGTFKYLSMPASTLNISGTATILIDPNDAYNNDCITAGVFYNGTINQSGGYIQADHLRIGEGVGATGKYNLSGGTANLTYGRMTVGYASGKMDANAVPNAIVGGSYGEVTMSGGLVQLNGAGAGLQIGLYRTSITSGYTDGNGANYISLAAGTGKMTVSDGVLRCTNPGTAANMNLGYGVGYVNPQDPNGGLYQAKGTFIQTGGSVGFDNEVRVGYEGGDGYLEVTGGSFIARRLRVGSTSTAVPQGALSTGTIRIGPGAYFEIGKRGGTYAWAQFYSPSQASAVKLIIDVTSAGAGKLITEGSAVLDPNNFTLDLNAISFRPKQGDKYTVIDANSAGNTPTQITSNITVGQDPNYSTMFTAAYNGGDLEATFRGFTAGDCGGDGTVGLLDLGKLGANWNKTGQAWADGDFSGDGVVGLLDLGALAANWNWTKPAGAPVPVPEPATMALLGLGGLALIRRKRS